MKINITISSSPPDVIADLKAGSEIMVVMPPDPKALKFKALGKPYKIKDAWIINFTPLLPKHANQWAAKWEDSKWTKMDLTDLPSFYST